MKAEIKKVVDGLKKYPEVAAVILFGSYAKGKAKPLSDIDLAVLVREPDKKIEAEIAGFSSATVDVVNFHRLPLYIQFEVLKHGKIVFVRDDNYFRQIKKEVLRAYLIKEEETAHLAAISMGS